MMVATRRCAQRFVVRRRVHLVLYYDFHECADEGELLARERELDYSYLLRAAPAAAAPADHETV